MTLDCMTSRRLVEVLQYFGCSDLQLCSLACQVLWNYCASADDVHSALGSMETTRLVAVLEALLGQSDYYYTSYVATFPQCKNCQPC
jgi:hypothetical protein